MLRRTRYFFMPAVCSVFLSYRCNTTDLRPLGCRGFQWSDVRVLQSQVFVFISTRINRLSRLFRDQDQVQLLARSRILGMFKYFHKVAPISVLLFVAFLFFFLLHLFFFCLRLKLTRERDPCAPIIVQECMLE